MDDIVERLRAYAAYGYGEPMASYHTDAMEEAAAEIERLREALKEIARWPDETYPFSAFPEMSAEDWRLARIGLASAGMTLDRVSASNMRRGLASVASFARDALGMSNLSTVPVQPSENPQER